MSDEIEDEPFPTDCPECEEPMQYVGARGQIGKDGKPVVYREYKCVTHGPFHFSRETPTPIPGHMPQPD